MNYRLLLWIVWGILIGTMSLPAEDDLAAANRAYTEGRYTEASLQFEQLIKKNGYSAELCYNLGNAYTKSGQLGLALLNYERARYLAPADPDIEHNLQLVRKEAGLPTNTLKWWQVLVLRVPVNLWYEILDGAIGLILLGFLLQFTRKFWTQYVSETGLGLVVKSIFFFGTPVALIFLLLTLYATAMDERERVEGVVIAKEVILRISPIETADRLDQLPEGERVTIDQKHEGFLLARARDKRFGWVEADQIAPIVPGAF